MKLRILGYHMTPESQVTGHRPQCSAALQHFQIGTECIQRFLGLVWVNSLPPLGPD